MFADKYLNKQKREMLVNETPNPDLGMIVVIPCHREPEILQTLKSLSNCKPPTCSVEVLVVVNHSEVATEETKSLNTKSLKEIKNWIPGNNSDLKFYCLGPIELQKKWAGAGLARKRGMDEAVSRFNRNNNPDGLIVSLDADTIVEQNYLVEIENHFKSNPKNVGVTISFEHQKRNIEPKHLEGIELYEKYLEYYKCALSYSGYPFSMFTIGSAFAVTADAYVKRGGMNRRQAGEDFYFLQNLVQLGTVGEINNTKVYPSARLSDRVPFGTGPIMQKWMCGEEDLTKTYNFGAFLDLKEFFESKDQFYKVTEREFKRLILSLPVPVVLFLEGDKFWLELKDLNNNCATLKSFQSRFFQKFNAFKILKYLNFAHESFHKKADLIDQLDQLKKLSDIS